MNIRFRQMAAILPLLTAVTAAQYNAGPAIGAFTPIASLPGAFVDRDRSV